VAHEYLRPCQRLGKGLFNRRNYDGAFRVKSTPNRHLIVDCLKRLGKCGLAYVPEVPFHTPRASKTNHMRWCVKWWAAAAFTITFTTSQLTTR